MRITTANGKLSVSLNHQEWKQMGVAMGWIKEAKIFSEKSKKACDDGMDFLPSKKKKFKEGDEEKDACEASKKQAGLPFEGAAPPFGSKKKVKDSEEDDEEKKEACKRK